MFILHPYGEPNPTSGWYGDKIPQDTAPTWRFLADAENRGIHVRHIKVQRDRYPRQVAEFWGKDDMIYLEDDKLPTIDDLAEIIGCNHTFCMFPYPSVFGIKGTVESWQESFPFGLGFCKFTLEAQKACPPSTWPFDRFKPTECDKIIETPLVERFGPMPLHPRMIAHNHWASKIAVIEQALKEPRKAMEAIRR